jgi:hypothetical protein
MANDPKGEGVVVPENAINAPHEMSSTSSTTVSAHDPDENFSLGMRGRFIFGILAVLTLMAALDGTSISVALPVCKIRS